MKIIYPAYSKHNFYFREHISRFVLEQDYIPLNPFMIFQYFMLDTIDRDKIREGNNNLIKKADELWVFGQISDGVLKEIKLAKQENKPVRYFEIVNSREIKEISPEECKYEDNLNMFKKEITGSQSKKIEVELRSFIAEERYKKLMEFFKENAKLVKEDFQETHYFDCDSDLRIQKGNESSKIWMKKGKIHDDAREEIEIKIPKEDFEKAREIFKNIGLNTEIIWLRDRKQFDWEGIKICLDYTKGYGYIIELEKIGTENNKQEIIEELKQKLNELNVPITPREEFERAYNFYKQNWRSLI